MSQSQHIAAAITSLSTRPLSSHMPPVRRPVSHYRVSRSGPGWDRWLQGFQLANDGIALSVALEKLQLASALKDREERVAEMDWWTDVVVFLRVVARRRNYVG